MNGWVIVIICILIVVGLAVVLVRAPCRRKPLAVTLARLPANETYPDDITPLRLIDKLSGRSSTVLLAQVAPSRQSV